MHATLSFLGMYNYDDTLFDELELPTVIDKQSVINNLLLETAELEVMISSPPVMKQALGFYSHKRLSMWTKMAAAFTEQYQLVQTITDSETRTPNLTTTGQNNGSDTSTTSRTGFNSNDWEQAEKVETSLGTGNTIHSTGTETTEKTRTDTGPMMERIMDQLELAKSDAIGYIINDIKRQFCLLVY